MFLRVGEIGPMGLFPMGSAIGTVLAVTKTVVVTGGGVETA
jgi:hypothetical protein